MIWDCLYPLSKSRAAATELDLINVWHTIPEPRMRRGIRNPAVYLLLEVILGIYCYAEGFVYANRSHITLTITRGSEERFIP